MLEDFHSGMETRSDSVGADEADIGAWPAPADSTRGVHVLSSGEAGAGAAERAKPPRRF